MRVVGYLVNILVSWVGAIAGGRELCAEGHMLSTGKRGLMGQCGLWLMRRGPSTRQPQREDGAAGS
jgi:hypothetical protein